MEQITLYYKQGASDKVYQASIEPLAGAYSVHYAYGRRGSTLQTGTKTQNPVSLQEAKAIFGRLVEEKTAKGYSPGKGGTPFRHTIREDQATGILPQLLNPVAEAEVGKLIRDPHWWLQEKHDGQRRMIRKVGSEVTGINRRGLQVALPQLWVADCLRCGADFLIDGEAVGEQLQVFDLLEFGGIDLREKAYLERYLTLMHLLTTWGSAFTRLVKTVCTDSEKKRFFQVLKDTNAEGAVFKRIDQPYTSDRPTQGGPALKLKFVDSGSFIVSRVNEQRSVCLTLLQDGVARSAGSVTIPANHPIPEVGQVVEVRYLYAFRESGHLYQPIYLGTRDDIPHAECVVSQLKYKAAGGPAPAVRLVH